MAIKILTSTADVEVFVDEVVRQADAHRSSLGFLAESAYWRSALQEKLHVAVDDVEGQLTYCGHIMFGGSNLQGRIIQVFVDPRARGKGVGNQLVESAIRKCARRGFLSVSARVAADLVDANKFWSKMGFTVIRQVDGGKTTGRTINFRARDVEVPSLLDFMRVRTSPKRACLGIGVDQMPRGPVYAFDLNVIFDVTKGRSKADQAGAIFQMAFDNYIRLTITREFLSELERSSRGSEDDQILLLSRKLPILTPRPNGEGAQQQLKDLAKIVFPNQARDGKLSVQDKSDIKHLATAIHHGVSGFITGEKAILRAGEELWQQYRLEVIAPHEFLSAQSVENSASIFCGDVIWSQGKDALSIGQMDSVEAVVLKGFLEKLQVPRSEIEKTIGRAGGAGAAKGCVVWQSSEIVALGSWGAGPNVSGVLPLHVFADDVHGSADLAVDHVLETAATDLSANSTVVITMSDIRGQVRRREVAFRHGFRATSSAMVSGSAFQKIAIGRPVTGSNWKDVQKRVQKISGVALPKVMPTFAQADECVEVMTPSGEAALIDTKDLETLMSPVLFLFQSRRGAILPIWKVYADELLGTSDQLTFLEYKEARLRRAKTYFCTSRAASVLAPGTPLLFYESGRAKGRSAAIAVGRVLASEICNKSALPDETLRGGVLDEAAVGTLTRSDEVLVVSFDNVMRLPVPVPFKRLKELGCADGSNIVTARAIPAEYIGKVVDESWGYERS